MWAGRDDVAVIENDDRRGVADRGKTVRDDQDGFADDELLERELDGGLAVAVEGAGGLVEDEDGGVAEEGAGEGEALFLSARETCAAFADEGFVPSGKTEDKLVRVGGAGGGLDLGARGLGARDEEIVVNRVVEKDGVLGDDGDIAAEVGEADRADIVAVEGDATGNGIEEAWDEIGEGGLAGAARADKCADGAGGDQDGDFLEDGFVRGVGEGDVGEGERAVGAGERQGVGRVDDRDGGLEDFFETVEGAQAALELVVQAAEFFDGLVAGVEGEEEGGERFLVQLDLIRVKQREGNTDGGDDFDEWGERLLIFEELHLRADESLRGPAEASDLAVFEAEGADLFGCAEIFAEDRGNTTEFGLDLAGALDEFFSDVADGQDGEWNHRERDEDQGDAFNLVGFPNDDADCADQRGGAADDLVGDGGEGDLELVGIGEPAGEEIAGGVFLEEREWEHLEFTEEIQADVFQHARADELDEIGVEVARDATQEKHGRDPQHDPGKLPPGKDGGAPGENHGKHPVDHQGQAGSGRHTGDDAAENGETEQAAVGLQITDIGAETADHRPVIERSGRPPFHLNLSRT